MLGCYVIDYATKQGIPVAAMQIPVRNGVTLAQGRSHRRHDLSGQHRDVDLGFASVEWTRQWIRKVGDTRLKGV